MLLGLTALLGALQPGVRSFFTCMFVPKNSLFLSIRCLGVASVFVEGKTDFVFAFLELRSGFSVVVLAAEIGILSVTGYLPRKEWV